MELNQELQKNLIDKSKDLIDTLFEISSKNYNTKLIDFNKGEIVYSVTPNYFVVPCKVVEVNSKDENENFSFKIIPHGYKISLLSRIKLFLTRKYGMKFSYPFPWNCTPIKGIAGVNIFNTEEEAKYCLQLILLYTTLNITLTSTKNIMKVKQGEEI